VYNVKAIITLLQPWDNMEIKVEMLTINCDLEGQFIGWRIGKWT
jgi:hypothetical protein